MTEKTEREILSESYIACEMEDSLVLSNKDNMLIILSPAGRWVYEDIMAGKSTDDIIRDMADELDTPREEVASFVDSILSSLLSHATLNANPPPPPRRPAKNGPPHPHAIHAYEAYGKRFLIRYGNADTENALHPLLAHREAPLDSPSTPFDFTCDFFKGGNGDFAFFLDEKEMVREASLIYVKGVAVFEIFSAFHPDRTWLAVFHGAVVKRKGRAVSLVGMSGSGKSTLAAALLKHGFEFVSDDLVVLDKGTRGVMETPFAIALKAGSWDILNFHVPDMETLPQTTLDNETLKFYVPFDKLPPSPIPVSSGPLFFIQYEKDASLEVTDLSSTEALSRLIEIGAWISHDEENMKTFLSWLCKTPAKALRYSDLSQARKAIVENVE